MSIFGSILSGIFGHAQAAGRQTASAGATPAGMPPPTGARAPSQTAGVKIPYAPGSVPQPSVDVEAVLDNMLAQKKTKLDWRHSIVDLMKLLELDSSLAARKELAKELHYTGATDGSAEMNIWLHKAVMKKLAENGGKVPESLKH
jgi:hypothetical protein